MDAADNEQTQILREIWNQMKALNSRTDGVIKGLEDLRVELKQEIGTLRDETRDGLASVRQEMHDGFARLDSRIDRLGDIAGDHVRELAVRVARLEALAGLPPTGAR